MLCVVYIELIRGVPLISLLFMASVMFPLFMPVGLNPDKLLRAQVAIILPQALRLVIPPLVNTFIGFFKDTSLVLIIGIYDLLTAGKVALADPIWQAYADEVYIVLALIYFVSCYSMARYSRGIEAHLGKSRRR
jgi:general L-amino acid transport system permease protein